MAVILTRVFEMTSVCI